MASRQSPDDEGSSAPPPGASGGNVGPAAGSSSASSDAAVASAAALAAAAASVLSGESSSSPGAGGGAVSSPGNSLATPSAAAASLFPDEMDDNDMSRLQAMLEARGFPPHLAGVLGPRMHHLILNRAMAPSATSKAQQLLQGIQATGDESRQLQAVIEMCQLLVMGNEDTLTGFPIRQVVPALIALLKMEHNFDLMNHACRALTYMMEALPRSTTVIVDAIPTFLEKLQSIQCMDVAEQSLTALEMLSKKHNKSILHAKGVMACLMYLDFFSITAQRNALAIASNCCQGLLPEEFVHVQDALSILSSRLVHEDKRSSETACLALSRLAESYKNDKNKLRDLAKPEVLANLQQILVASPPGAVSSNTFVTVLHILVVMSSHGTEVGPMLLEEGIVVTLKQLLICTTSGGTNSKALAASTNTEDFELLQRNPQELYEITSLIAELMPPLPADGIFAVDALLAKPGAYIRDPVLWQWQDDRGNWHTYGYNDCRIIEAAFVAGEDEASLANGGKSFNLNLKSMHEIREENGTARPIQRKLTSQLQAETESEVKKQKRARHLELTSHLTKELLPVLLEVYSTSAGPGVRHSCIQAFLRMAYHSSQLLLSEVLKVPAVSSQIAGMLSSGDLKIVVGALQLSELLLQKMPDEFGVHFRREGVLHQVQKLTDPDHPICIQQFNETSSLAATSTSWGSGGHSAHGHGGLGGNSGRCWTVAGTSLANMFPDQLRVPKRRDESSSSPDTSGGAGTGATASTSGSAPAQAPMRLSDMLKRKRVSKRTSGRKGRHSEGSATDLSSAAAAGPSTSGNHASLASPHGAYDMSHYASPSLEVGAMSGGPATPSRRSRLADRTSSLLSQLHPARWVRSSGANTASGGGTSLSEGGASRKDLAAAAAQKAAFTASSPATLAHSREKAKRWVREQASRFLESYFKESLGSRHPALTILRRLSAQVDHLTRKPKDGERSLRGILSVLLENDISPFEVTQSGLVPALLTYLTKQELDSSSHGEEVSREMRVRTFAHVFLGCPKMADATEEDDNDNGDIVSLDSDAPPKFAMFVQKLNACVNHLEQFPIKMHDMTSGSSGVKSAGSTLRFFKTHHLKCSLQRHPDCASLKSWKGGLVKIDPLALVQAIERYLISRGYGHPQDKDSAGSEDDDMSDEGTDDLLPSGSRERHDAGSNPNSSVAAASSASSSGNANNASSSSSSTSSAFASTSSGTTPAIPSTSGGTHRLEFFIGEHMLPYDMTVYQAVQQFGGAPTLDVSDSDSDNRSSGSSAAAAAAAAMGGGGIYGSPGIWARIHTIYYRPAVDKDAITTTSTGTTSKHKSDGKKGTKGSSKQSKRKAPPDELWNEGKPPERAGPLDSFLVDQLPKTTSSSSGLNDPSLDVLCLLRALHALNRYWGSLYAVTYYHPVISTAEFVNPKLTAKVNRQLQDPIIIMTSNLPAWLKDLASACPFLFPFETRQLLFYVTSFDRDRALLRLLDSAPELGASDAGQERVTPDLERKKRVISRENLSGQAEMIMAELAHSRSLLEIQYENEVGTGLGPTLEFYTLVSKELQRADLSLWKGDAVRIGGSGGIGGSEDVMDSDDNGGADGDEDEECLEYVYSSTGLYPLPLARNAKSGARTRLRAKFIFLGKFIAKAVLDNRMVDLPFSRPFYQWLLREETTFGTRDLLHIDPTIAGTVSQLEGLARKKRRSENDERLPAQERRARLDALTVDGCPVEDLGLDFTLPGYPDIELRRGGKDMCVTLDNLQQYVRLVSHWLLVEGVATQMEAVREGFESVFPLSTLKMFYPDELDQIFCGGTGSVSAYSPWDSRLLMEACKPDHGYTSESRALRFLFEVMASYTREEQREFLQFVTGCPRLPVGGFKSLSPPLTIVKKTFDSPDVNPDDYLPSVMTCVNYLKLPDYSSKAIMLEKLRIASREGQYCFHLS